MMGNSFQFTATISGTNGQSATVTAFFNSPATGIISSEPATCTLFVGGSPLSCTFTVATTWNTLLSNNLNLPSAIAVTADNNASVIGSPLGELTPAAYLPQTGQTPTIPLDVSSMTGTDGNVHAGIPWAYNGSDSTIPSPRFEGVYSGCAIKDKLTNLVWLLDPSTVGGVLDWQTALDTANSGTWCGRVAGTWRMPNINELMSLINYGYANPADWLMYGSGTSGTPDCNGTCFSNIAANYWSSTSAAFDTGIAWVINMTLPGGYIGPNGSKTVNNYWLLWPVRDGE